jgi:hypothetical protein
MGRRGRERKPSPGGSSDFEFERTLADAEADQVATRERVGEPSEHADESCICGHREFVLEAFMHVVDGRLRPDPVEVESLTCPECGREYEAVPAGEGRVLRGDFRGWADVDD